MKVLVLFCLLGFALGLPTENHSWEEMVQYEILGYHENIGIKKAAQIKAAEEAMDFDGMNRIAGGTAAALGQYPHMGGLVIDLTTGQQSVCGSSLLSSTRAVTAAHCWYERTSQARQFTVVLGSVLLFTGGTRVTTSNVQVHEGWNPFVTTSDWLHNDVAIITLPTVALSSIVAPIALPSGNLLTNNFNGATVQAAGFGAQGDGVGITLGQTLHHVTLEVIDNASCQRFFGNAVTTSTICISGANRRSTCGGDSGGPLQVNTGGQNVLIGITSFGSSLGCEWGWPAAFARVTSFTPWIQARL